jgi:hypothetical protein
MSKPSIHPFLLNKKTRPQAGSIARNAKERACSKAGYKSSARKSDQKKART